MLKVCRKELTLAFLLTIPVLASFAHAEKRPFEVRDSVEMTYFGTLLNSEPLELDDDGIVSPDGKWIVKVTHRGVLPGGATEGTIWLFDAAALKRSVNSEADAVPKPTVLARVAAAVNGIDFVADRSRTISELRWSKDSSFLSFLARDGRENRQLFTVDLRTRMTAAVSSETQDVVAYTPTHNGFMYLAAADRREDEEWHSTGPGIPDIQVGTGSSLIELLYPHWVGDGCCRPLKLSLWQVMDGHAAPILDPTSKFPMEVVSRYGAQLLSLSPDEKRLVTIAYDDARGNAATTLRYRVIDLEHGGIRNLLELPIVPNEDGYRGRYRARWSSDLRYIAVSILGKEGKAASDSEITSACAVVVLEVSSSLTACALPLRNYDQGALYSMQWVASGRELRVRYRRRGITLYEDAIVKRKGGQWTTTAEHLPPLDLPLELTVKEALNDPPMLLATDPKTLKTRVVWDPNPQLADVSLGSVSVYEWKDAHGRSISGGLAKPAGYVLGRAYPLVIQTHGFSPRDFFRVGYGETANAGRALTSRGILVLQVEEPFEPYHHTWQAASENGTNVYLAAIDQLTAEGLVDPKKIGITGYSATGLKVSNSLIRSPNRFAAAALSNTDPGSLMDYYIYIDYLDPNYAEYNAQLDAGAKPYGEGLKLWIERAPDFATGNISAPLLLSPTTPADLLTEWSLYAQLRDQGKPVDLLYIRSGQHNLTKPLQRFVQQEMIVDWFDFWLNDHEDLSSAKANQYARWEKIRSARNTSVSELSH